MTTTIVYASTNDGMLENSSTNPTTARNGGGSWTINSTVDGDVRWGWKFSSPNYFACEAFQEWSYTVPANEIITGAYIRLRALTAMSAGVNRALEIREFDWGGTMTTASWRTPAQLNALTQLGAILQGQNAGSLYMSVGSAALNARVQSGSPLRTVTTSDNMRSGIGPTGDEEGFYYSADQSGTSNDPALVFTSMPVGYLNPILGAQVQLSDGSHAYIENNTSATPVLQLKHRTVAGTVSTVATLPASSAADPTEYFSGTYTGPGSSSSYQGLALVIDSSDNLYVVGRYGGNGATGLAAQAYQKSVGYTWTQKTFRSTSLPSYSAGNLNNFAGAWHSTGTNGTMMVVASHEPGWTPNTTGDTVYALVNCDYLLTGAGSMLRASGAARGNVVDAGVDGNNYTTWVNPVGNALDVVAEPSTTNRGIVVCTAPYNTGIGDSYPISVYRYVLNTGGVGLSDTDGGAGTSGPTSANVVKDAGAKLRVLPISSTTFATVTADPTSGWGITVDVLQNSGTSSSFSSLGRIRLDGGVASMPSAATLSTSSLWDAVYNPTDNKIYIYYFDTANNLRLMRTSVNLSTYLAANDQVQVSASVGAAGATNSALRVHRGPTNGAQVLVSVQSKSSGGTLSTQYVTDTYNVAPTAPTLTAKSNFSGATTAAFAWTFNDPNPGDTQSAYQMQINTSGGVFAFDTAKVDAASATYVGSGAASTGNNVSLTPAIPSGNIGDTILMWASIRNSGTGVVGTAPSGWITLNTFGNTALMAKVADTTSESAPTVTFTGGVVNADTLARAHRFRNLPLRVAASQALLNISAQNVAYPALTVPLANSVVFVYGWKQDDWTSVASLAGMTEIDDTFATAGDDAAQALDYVIQTTATNVTAGSMTVTGGTSAISRGVTYSLGPTAGGPTASTYTLPANTLTDPGSWQWRVRTWDAAGLVGPWSNFGTFSTAAGGTVTITSPAADNPGGQITDSYTITWSVAGTTQAYYRVKVVKTSDSSTLSDTGIVASVATSALVTGLTSGSEYRVEVTVRNAALVDSATGTRLITPSYSAPDQPTVTVTPMGDLGYTLVSVSNPTATGSRPTPNYNQILRRQTGVGTYTVIGQVGVSSTYKDYTAQSGMTYQYIARAVAL